MAILSAEQTLESLQHFMPVSVREASLGQGRVGLVIIDPVVGFTSRGMLSDPASMQPMVDTIDALARKLLNELDTRLSIYVFRDHHGADQLEDPYPPHCQEGTGEELLDPKLRWLEKEKQVTVFGKDCINGMVGSLIPTERYTLKASTGAMVESSTFRSDFADWILREDIDQLLVVGDCTDICVLDFVVSALSARNHGMFADSRKGMPIQVYAAGCATFHLPDPGSLGLPETARHDKGVTHHSALYFMQSRGAVIVGSLE